MRFVPRYAVSYDGVIHKGGIPFEIDPEDAAEMSRHGKVETKPETMNETAAEAEPEQPAKRPGRTKKTN